MPTLLARVSVRDVLHHESPIPVIWGYCLADELRFITSPYLSFLCHGSQLGLFLCCKRTSVTYHVPYIVDILDTNVQLLSKYIISKQGSFIHQYSAVDHHVCSSLISASIPHYRVAGRYCCELFRCRNARVGPTDSRYLYINIPVFSLIQRNKTTRRICAASKATSSDEY